MRDISPEKNSELTYAPWVILNNILSGARSQTEKVINHVTPLIGITQNRSIHEESRLAVARGWDRGNGEQLPNERKAQ